MDLNEKNHSIENDRFFHKIALVKRITHRPIPISDKIININIIIKNKILKTFIQLYTHKISLKKCRKIQLKKSLRQSTEMKMNNKKQRSKIMFKKIN